MDYSVNGTNKQLLRKWDCFISFQIPKSIQNRIKCKKRKAEVKT